MKERNILLRTKLVQIAFATIAVVFFSTLTAQASDSDGTIDATLKYAWGEKLGWINFKPTNGGLRITDNAVTGYAWSNDAGWINFAPTLGGVTNNCQGQLGGYAWSSQKGWIYMSGVTISATGRFAGEGGTLGTTAGRISFSCANCNVQTDWRPCDTRGGGGGVVIPPPVVEPVIPPVEPVVPPVIPPDVPPVVPEIPAENPPVIPEQPATPPQQNEPSVPPVMPPSETPSQPAEGSGSGSSPATSENGAAEGGGAGGGVGTDQESEQVVRPNEEEIALPTAAGILKNPIKELKKIPQAVPAAAKKVQKAVTKQAQEVKEVLEQPVVQATALPAMVAVTLTSVAGSMGYGTLFNYLTLFMTQPLLLFGGSKKRRFGVVFNSLSKLPVELAAIRIRDTNGRIVQTKVTDRQGRYNFFVPKGEYVFELDKAGYVYPTGYLSGRKRDSVYGDLLEGARVKCETDEVLTFNIPLDPKEREELPSVMLRRMFLKKLQSSGAAFSTVLAILVALLLQNALSVGLAVLQILAYSMLYSHNAKARIKKYGVVKDALTGRVLSKAIVRVMNTEFNQVLETQVTDGKGRYAFLVGPGKYFVTVEKPEYGKLRSQDLDMTGFNNAVIDLDLKLQKV